MPMQAAGKLNTGNVGNQQKEEQKLKAFYMIICRWKENVS